MSIFQSRLLFLQVAVSVHPKKQLPQKKTLKKEKILKNELYLPNNVKTKICQ